MPRFNPVYAGPLMCYGKAGWGFGMDDKKRAFLDAYAELGMLGHAAKRVGISPQLVHYWLRTDKEFRDAYGEAFDVAISLAEDELYRRAVHGVDKPIFYKDKQIGSVKEYSDAALKLFLQANKPEKYRERHDVSVTGEIDIAAAILARRKALKLSK